MNEENTVIELDTHQIWKQCDPYFEKLNAMLTENEFYRRVNATGKDTENAG